MELYNSPELYERVIHEDLEKHQQVRLVVNTFRGVEYLSLRKYYLDYREEWKPSSEGVSMALDFTNSKELFIGLVEILSLAESKQAIEENFSELLQSIYK